jgi:hypothetical protein
MYEFTDKQKVLLEIADSLLLEGHCKINSALCMMDEVRAELARSDANAGIALLDLAAAESQISKALHHSSGYSIQMFVGLEDQAKGAFFDNSED